jgi:hypothetical protein
MIDVIGFVPKGEDTALSAREIWQAVDCWSQHAIRHNLERLVTGGTVFRLTEPTPSGGVINRYWRA